MKKEVKVYDVLQQATKQWYLRLHHGLHIEIRYSMCLGIGQEIMRKMLKNSESNFIIIIKNIPSRRTLYSTKGKGYKTYEEALEKGIEKAYKIVHDRSK